MLVTKCICRDLAFADLKAEADRHACGFEELRERTDCCTGCTTCEAYVRRMLRTGETGIPLMSPGEVTLEMHRADT